MSIRTFIAIMFFSALVGVFSWISILINASPAQGALVIFSFYLTLAIFFISLFTLIGFFLRRIISPNNILFSLVGVSFRQAVLFSIAIVGTLFFQNLGILRWWSVSLLIGSVILLELYFVSR